MIYKAKIVIVVLITILGSGCLSTPRGDADDYSEMREGTIYRTYQKVSIEAMKPVVKEYNRKLAKENKPQNAEIHVHALLGLIWVVSSQSKYALAEAEYAVTQASEPRDLYAALTIQSLAMHEQGWHHLAKKNANNAKSLVKNHNMKNRYNNAISLVHVAGSAMALKEGDIPFVASEVKEFGTVTNQAWLVDLGDATQDAYSGAQNKAIAKLEKIKADPKLSKKESEGIDRALDAAKSGGKDMGTAVAKAAVAIVYDVGFKTNPLTPVVLKKLPEKYRAKIARHF